MERYALCHTMERYALCRNSVIPQVFSLGPVALIVAHPDDETISAGGILSCIGQLVHVTDGAPRAFGDRRREYARQRREELLAALKIAGVPAGKTRTLDYIDQEASLDLTGLARRIAEILQEFRPAAVLTHPYEGGHPDHDATAFGVHMACALQNVAAPIYEFTSYHAAIGGAGFQPGFQPAMQTGCFLPGQDPGEPVVLSPAERERKTRMVACFVSQQEVLHNFAIGEERFRRAPAYDFTSPPHPGKLFYENFDWGITGERWRRLVEEALEAA